jgi:hypothetical protein
MYIYMCDVTVYMYAALVASVKHVYCSVCVCVWSHPSLCECGYSVLFSEENVGLHFCIDEWLIVLILPSLNVIMLTYYLSRHMQWYNSIAVHVDGSCIHVCCTHWMIDSRFILSFSLPLSLSLSLSLPPPPTHTLDWRGFVSNRAPGDLAVYRPQRSWNDQSSFVANHISQNPPSLAKKTA